MRTREYFLIAGMVILFGIAGRNDMRDEQAVADELTNAPAEMVQRAVEQQCGGEADVVQTSRGLRCVGDIYDETQLAQAPGGAQ